MNDTQRWDALAKEKGPMRAAWDEDHDETEEHLMEILPYMPGMGTLIEIGCGPGRLTIPVAEALPHCDIVGLDVSNRMVRNQFWPSNVRTAINSGRLPTAYAPYHGGYSMLTFQHLTEDSVMSYINQLYRYFLPGARFRLQAVLGKTDQYEWYWKDWIGRFEDEGFTVSDLGEKGWADSRPWIWLTATR